VVGELAETAQVPAAATNHPELVAAQADRQRALLELQRARREPWPDITVGVAGGRDLASDETLVEVRIAVPLPVFDRARGRRRETKALAEIAGLELAGKQQELATRWHLAQTRLRAAQDQADAYRIRILPQATTALRLVRTGYEAGKFGFLDMLDTQRTLAETRLAYLDRLLELNVALAELESLAGTTAGGSDK
jgi:cobalt-zinc-cadmium efflux system outer membrane protein